MGNPVPNKMSANSVCPHCFNQIDTDVCWCGDDEKSHESWYNFTHSFVPMGCTCGYHNPPKNPWEKIIDSEL